MQTPQSPTEPARPPEIAKKPKMPLDYILRKMHDAMELVFNYSHDPNFVPSCDQLLLLEMIYKQMTAHHAMMLVILQTMRERARLAASAQ
jgi:hypothetical protein